MIRRREEIRATAGLFLRGLAGSTVFFCLVEGRGRVDALYFSAATAAAVGCGDLAPTTATGKVGAAVPILPGIGTLAALVQQIAERVIENRVGRQRDNRRD